MVDLPPIRLYEFGSPDRWRKAVIRAVEENVTLGQAKTIIEHDGVRIRTQVLGTSLINWYEAEVFKSGDTTMVGCRCQAGQNAVPCKHIARVFLEKKWLPWPQGIVVRPPVVLPEVEPDLVLEVVKGVVNDDVRTDVEGSPREVAAQSNTLG
jgi:hypothetical protein